jgi:hypothetical protein
MKRLVAASALCALAACSDVGSSSDTVIAIRVTPPPGGVVEVGDTVQYTAVTLNQDGDSINAPVRWATPDTQNISLDSLTGKVVGKLGGTQASVQASSEGLVATPNVITVVVTADTIILVPPDTVRVDTLPASASPPLVARLEALHPAGPVVSRPLYYEVVEPVFPDTASETVRFPNGAVVDTVLTGANGEPTTPILLSRVTGRPSPDSAIVEVRSTRYQNSQPVPGSGQRWIVRFSN